VRRVREGKATWELPEGRRRLGRRMQELAGLIWPGREEACELPANHDRLRVRHMQYFDLVRSLQEFGPSGRGRRSRRRDKGEA
jgi:hypothetical protein